MDDQMLQWSKPAGSFLLVAGVFLAAVAAVSNANIGEFDEHWEKRREAAEAAAREVYKPDPFNVTNELNHAVIRSTERGILRRELSGKNSKYKGPCLATNPIDRCWRCRKDWATDRKRLARCAMGFGRGATGGVRGKIYVVTDPSDGDAANPRYGTLRWGAMQPAPLWITFAKSMVIRLTQELLVASDKTIDGRGAQVHYHPYPQDKVMQITVAFNHFGRGLVQRMPRCRWGFFHVVNNDYTHWLMYAIGGGMSPTILSQGNRYIAPPNIAAKLITRHYAPDWEWKNWAWHSEGDLFMNGAYFQASNGAINRKVKNSDMVKPKPGSYVRRLTRFAGALSCRPGEPC